MINRLPVDDQKGTQASETRSGSACLQCGASLPAGLTCSDLFYAAQLKEIEDPEYYRVHHLSVPCYMLQHDTYSRQGWMEVYHLLEQFHAGLTAQEARRMITKKIAGGKKAFSLTKGERMPGLDAVPWRWSIGQIRLDTAEHYCEDVRQWAESILEDARLLVDQSLTDAD